MDEFLGIVGLFAFAIMAGAVCGIIAIAQLSNLKQEIAQLKAKVLSLELANNKLSHNEGEDKSVDYSTAQHADTAQANSNEPTFNQVSPNQPKQSNQPREQVKTPASSIKPPANVSESNHKLGSKNLTPSLFTSLFEKLRSDFEQNWMTWIGAIALALGGIFLAKYSLEAGLLSPTMRLTLGGLFGGGLIAAAAYMHYKNSVFEGFNNYIPAALATGGFITCFALTLLAYSSYSLISPLSAFVVLGVIAISASAMAIMLGPVLAVLGIIGAYCVPVLVHTGSNNLFALYMYIGFISLSAALVAHKVQRAWLWYLLWAGHLGWYIVGFTIANSSTIWLMGTYGLLSVIGLIAVPRLGLKLAVVETRPHSLKRLINALPSHPLMLACIVPLLIAMLFDSDNYLQWQIINALGILTLLFLVIKNSRWDLWQGAALIIAALILLSTPSYYIDFSDSLFIFKHPYGSALFLGLALSAYGLYFGIKWAPKRLAFHITASFSVFIMIATLYAIIPNHALAAAYPLWAVILLISSAILIKCAMSGATLFQRFSYWVGANANITLAITMLLNDSGLTIALAIQVLLISVLINRYRVPMPHWPIKALVAALLLRLTLSPWTPSYEALSVLGMHWSLVVYPLCVVLFYVAAKCFSASQLKVWLEGAALHCLALFITTETSYQLVGHYPQFGSLSFYEQALLTCNWLALGCVYLHRARIAGSLAKLYQVAGMALAGAAGITTLSTLLNANPFLSAIYIGEIIVFNWLFLLWLVPAGLVLWLYRLIKPLYTKVAPFILIVAGALSVLAINGFIRQYWQGPYIYISTGASNAELYSYSVIWLVLGAITVVLGHLKNQLLIQKIGLGVLAAVILKVFLVDMANLTGLLKALSFIGLGLSLVGLSWLFQKLRSRVKQA
ncbi:DUF2339 domain-containing protein [Pseudoalteromonas sp. P1-7a]|uniref:DUF2339 domain-containing protein n=1 Tax=Pseudoalteromonas sp. P1-7a TaxID=1723755 RepID=UPI0006D68458|nr:DUF2339 domain-containing protein [Pseudoalteromonas sp. P1-7a]KPZ62465.1 hypothetical protein AN389_00918 [Pseudoalteromonas sp. P1-7a]